MARADAANLQAQKDFGLGFAPSGQLLARNGGTDEAFVLLSHAAKLLAAAGRGRPDERQHSAQRGRLPPRDSAMPTRPSRRIACGRPAARLGHWREARDRFQEAYAFWKELRDRGIAPARTAARPEALALEIAKCDAALGGEL